MPVNSFEKPENQMPRLPNCLRNRLNCLGKQSYHSQRSTLPSQEVATLPLGPLRLRTWFFCWHVYLTCYIIFIRKIDERQKIMLSIYDKFTKKKLYIASLLPSGFLLHYNVTFLRRIQKF